MADGDVTVQIIDNTSRNANVLDGVDDYLDAAHTDLLTPSFLADGLTISARICPRSQGALGARIVDKSEGQNAENGFSFKTPQAPSNRLGFLVQPDGTTCVSAVDSIYYNKGLWYHVVVTCTYGGLVNFYINGVLSGTADQDCGHNLGEVINTENIIVGNCKDFGMYDRCTDGSLAEVKVWNRVISTEEIQRDYEGMAVDVSTDYNVKSLIHYWKLAGDYTDYGRAKCDLTNHGSIVGNMDDAIGAILRLQRTSADDKFLLCQGLKRQVITVGIAE
jgi:hypothetical protein